jgi:sugar/nucleoside kinase (ribokinase family)
MTAKYSLLALGHALVDVLAPASDDFIDKQSMLYGMHRNSMNLIDEPRALQLYGMMGPATEMSGGSAGNTMACFASLGGRGAYIGKVGNDQLGQIFRHDLKSIGIDYDVPPSEAGPATGRCMVLIAPDGERTMNTFLGAAATLSPDDLDAQAIASSAVTYLEGYLFDQPLAMEAFYTAARIAHDAGRKVSLTLSDPFCVGRHRKAFQDLVENHVDVLFANEEEARSLYEVDTIEQAVETLKSKCEIAVITRSEKGSLILHGNDLYEVKAEPVSKVVDTTGAGDAYAAGFLFGYTEGMSLRECGKLGSIAAAEVISHIGPRPQANLAALAKAA